ncbi:MAG: HAD family hydrolase [Anaerolineales bacterium]|nr:HAD family hydrolase [Anaerolineales bacterium]
MKISLVLFDLGSTLLYSKDPWLPIFHRADRHLLDVFHTAGQPVEKRHLNEGDSPFLLAYYADQGSNLIEKTSFRVLREALNQSGFSNIPDSLLRAALDAMYAVTQQNWYLEEDALPTLETLRHLGYRLGLISNTSDDRNVQQLLDRHGLRPYFEYIITSAACGIRKPDPRIFQMALEYFGIAPSEAAMVGDTLEADILGAKNLGIYSIWINRRASPLPDLSLIHI